MLHKMPYLMIALLLIGCGASRQAVVPVSVSPIYHRSIINLLIGQMELRELVIRESIRMEMRQTPL